MGNVQESFFELLPHMVEVGADDQGRIKYAGTRFEYLQTSMFSELFYAMEEATDDSIKQKIEEFGVQAGIDITERVNQDFKDVSILEVVKLLIKSRFNYQAIRNISSTTNKSQLEKILAYGAYVGWFNSGNILEYDKEAPRLEVEIFECFEANSYGETGKKECMFLPGVCKGIIACLSDLDPDELIQREEECSSAESDRCKIVVERK